MGSAIKSGVGKHTGYIADTGFPDVPSGYEHASIYCSSQQTPLPSVPSCLRTNFFSPVMKTLWPFENISTLCFDNIVLSARVLLASILAAVRSRNRNGDRSRLGQSLNKHGRKMPASLTPSKNSPCSDLPRCGARLGRPKQGWRTILV